nr:hypothetical protein [Tanacetum cinerariifolium]
LVALGLAEGSEVAAHVGRHQLLDVHLVEHQPPDLLVHLVGKVVVARAQAAALQAGLGQFQHVLVFAAQQAFSVELHPLAGLQVGGVLGFQAFVLGGHITNNVAGGHGIGKQIFIQLRPPAASAAELEREAVGLGGFVQPDQAYRY